MSGKPVVAVIFKKEVQRRVLDETALADLEAQFSVRWPKSDGAIPAEEAQELLAGAEGVLSSWGFAEGAHELLPQAPKLGIVAHAAGSVKRLVSDALFEKGVVVTSAAAHIAVDVAQYAVALMVIGCKNVMAIAPRVSGGAWRRPPEGCRAPDDFRYATVGIVSASHVGRNVLRLLQGYEVEVLLYDPFVTPERAKELGAAKVELDELFRRSDVVSVHAPSIPATRHMVNASMLGRMKDGAGLINTSRGTLVDEAALAAELQKGRLWAFLDVTDPEPPAPASPLFHCPNLYLTPHMAGSVGRASRRLGRAALEELRRFFSGEPPRYPVTREMLERIA